MKLLLLLFLFPVLMVHSVRAQDAAAVFPLLGKWREVGYTDAKGVFHAEKKSRTYDFRKNLYVVIIEAGDTEPTHDTFYTFQPPDIYLQKEYHGDSDHAYRVRFHVDGDTATVKYSELDAKADPDDKPEGTIKLQRMKAAKSDSKKTEH